MTIWDLVYQEFYENGGINLLDPYKNVHKMWKRGLISEIQARISCEQLFDTYHAIHKK